MNMFFCEKKIKLTVAEQVRTYIRINMFFPYLSQRYVRTVPVWSTIRIHCSWYIGTRNRPTAVAFILEGVSGRGAVSSQCTAAAISSQGASMFLLSRSGSGTEGGRMTAVLP